jgi:hypothetical protein
MMHQNDLHFTTNDSIDDAIAGYYDLAQILSTKLWNDPPRSRKGQQPIDRAKNTLRKEVRTTRRITSDVLAD